MSVIITMLGSNDQPIGNPIRLDVLMSEAVEAMNSRDWSKRPHIWAVRITDGYRVVVRRKPTDAHGPGHLPRLRAVPDPDPKIPGQRPPTLRVVGL